MAKLWNSLIEMQKENKRILMTKKLLKALRGFYAEGKRVWKCQALNNFFVIDPLGRVAGCHGHDFVGSVFDLPKTWKSQEFKHLRRAYSECTECNYLCYIFYSLQGGPVGNISVALDQWRNAGLVIKKNN
jgi:hypothetical protein